MSHSVTEMSKLKEIVKQVSGSLLVQDQGYCSLGGVSASFCLLPSLTKPFMLTIRAITSHNDSV